MDKRSIQQPRARVVHPPEDLPCDPASFYSARANLGDLLPPPEVLSKPALTRLGPPPFPRGSFPLLGFLATLYDHVAQGASPSSGRPAVMSQAEDPEAV